MRQRSVPLKVKETELAAALNSPVSTSPVNVMLGDAALPEEKTPVLITVTPEKVGELIKPETDVVTVPSFGATPVV
jgi:hypothetical protein